MQGSYKAAATRRKQKVRETFFAGLLEKLTGAGLRPTRQRLALAGLLFNGGDRHVTAEQLHAAAQAASIQVSLATVYNTLGQFRDAGLLREVSVEPGRTYFDTNISDHHHFFLEDSGRLVDIPANALDIGQLPPPPEGTRIAQVAVVIRVQENARAA